MKNHISFMQMEAIWLVYVIAFIAIDFQGYCGHLLNHKVNYFWNEYVVHHSSEEYNLPCDLRQSVSNIFGIYAIFLIPAALLGVPPQVITVISPIHLFMQFWYHTRHIPKLGFLEYIIVTPSIHRVHHAINPEYIDKNPGQIFIIWDKIFGTYQKELDEVLPVYGVKKAAETWNPIIINYQHVWRIIQDAWRAGSWVDKLRVWFMPVGWRLADVAEKYPIEIIENPYTMEKFGIKASTSLHVWSWIQYIMSTFFLVIMLINFASSEIESIMLLGAFLFATIYMMGRSPYAFWMETLKSSGGLYLIYTTGDWFGIDTFIPFGSFMVSGYFVASILIIAYFVFVEFREDREIAVAA